MKAILHNTQPWFKSWFNSDFYHQLYAHRNQQEANEFIDNLLDLLEPVAEATMWDLGCGAGRHAKQLASYGYHVTGTDLAFASIQTAKKFEHDRLHFYRRDMRKPFAIGYFDYVFNFFTSFGYFKSEEENQTVIDHIAQALKPGGKLVMDYLNAHNADQNLVPKEKKELDGVIYDIKRWSDETHISKKIGIDNMPSGENLEFTEQVEKIYLHQFTLLFEKSGLQLQQVYGDYQLNEYDTETSPRLMMIAVKK